MTGSKEWHKALVEAEITLFDSSITGRTLAIKTGYRPNHNFGSKENYEMRMGQITVPNGEWIQPGQTKEVKIEFLFPEGYIIQLEPGLTWRIQEGAKHVANGKILRILFSES